MRATETFRQQHADIVVVVEEIRKLLTPESVAQDSQSIARLIAQFMGKLNVHLSAEDKTLYPKLLAHKNAHVQSLTQRFISEMGGIADAVGGYREQWSSARRIQDSPEEFIVQTRRLFSALEKRIKSENTILYKTLDDLEMQAGNQKAG